MLIKQLPMKIKTERHICEFHKRHPGKRFPGCTCSGSITSIVKPFEEWTEEEKRFMADPFAGYGD